MATGTAIWYRAGEPLVPIRLVLLRDPKGKLDSMAIACTKLEMDAIQIVKHYPLAPNITQLAGVDL